MVMLHKFENLYPALLYQMFLFLPDMWQKTRNYQNREPGYQRRTPGRGSVPMHDQDGSDPDRMYSLGVFPNCCLKHLVK